MARRKNPPQKLELTARDLIITDIRKISEIEFKTIIIRILTGLENSIEGTRESLTTKLKELRNRPKIKNAVTDKQYGMDAVTMRMDEAEEQINDIEDKIMKIMVMKKVGKKSIGSWM